MNHLFSSNREAALSALIVPLFLVVFSSATNAQVAGDVENGKSVFERAGCSRCHGSAGEGMSSTGNQAGPPKIAGTHLPLRDFVAAVRNPKGQMPPFGSRQVSDKELSDVYAFLHSEDLSLNVVLPSSASPRMANAFMYHSAATSATGIRDKVLFRPADLVSGRPDPLFGVRCVRSTTGRSDATLHIESSL